MANYDDIFNASAQEGTEDKSFVSFNKEEWAAQKKQERESAFAMIDETAQRMANDGSLFQSYLDVQARFDRYSVGNAVLITAQKADATQLSDFKGWKNNGVFIKKGESGIVLLEPGEEYTKEDGTVGVSYNSKKVFDISQTTAKAKDRPAMKRDERLLLKAIIHNGIYGVDEQIVAVALSQVGNVGGEPYWSWYGFGSRVEWCACFVSWCANECGYIDTGVIPKFAGCVNGVQWFRERGQWADNAMQPSPGMIIFFDWDNKGSSGPQDGQADHVGIVQKVENGIVYTIEGNSGDSCRVNQYPVGYYEILGYGVVAY